MLVCDSTLWSRKTGNLGVPTDTSLWIQRFRWVCTFWTYRTWILGAQVEPTREKTFLSAFPYKIPKPQCKRPARPVITILKLWIDVYTLLLYHRPNSK